MVNNKKITDEEGIEILSNFAEKLIESQKSLDPDIQKIVNEHFFEMITTKEDLKKRKK